MHGRERDREGEGEGEVEGEREREGKKAATSRPVGVCGILITKAKCRQNLKEGVQSVQDTCERNPGLGGFQLSPPPVAVSIASVW